MKLNWANSIELTLEKVKSKGFRIPAHPKFLEFLTLCIDKEYIFKSVNCNGKINLDYPHYILFFSFENKKHEYSFLTMDYTDQEFYFNSDPSEGIGPQVHLIIPESDGDTTTKHTFDLSSDTEIYSFTKQSNWKYKNG